MAENKKIEIEYEIKTSAKILYNYVSTAGGLAEWFADDVNVSRNIYTFVWDGVEQKAELMVNRPNKCVRFQWLDEDTQNGYFEFKIVQQELTGDIALLITDFAEEGDEEDIIGLWDVQIAKLRNMLGV